MFVDVPQIKSKWVGDSEKNIKALFDRYRALVNHSDLAPIMLFNEADAIFGVRKKGAEGTRCELFADDDAGRTAAFELLVQVLILLAGRERNDLRDNVGDQFLGK